MAAPVPGQLGMELAAFSIGPTQVGTATVMHGAGDEEDPLHSRRPPADDDDNGQDGSLRAPVARVSRFATAAFLALAAGHLLLLREQWLTTADRGTLLLRLTLPGASLAFESGVYAAGALGRFSTARSALEVLGRVRLLVSTIAWAWLLPWSAELSCRCGAADPRRGWIMVLNAETIATAITAYFLLRELAFMIRGEPPSALDPSLQPKFGDCLPSNALLGGQFRLNKAELEASGRVVFVPARPRKGLYASPGLALASHLLAGLALWSSTPVPARLLAGAVCALAARMFSDFSGLGDERETSAAPARGPSPQGVASGGFGCARDVSRLVCRAGELVWIWCCVQQLQLCESSASWLPKCE
mmetsp:Transcript_117221/g.373394  ORF Transcript_117221/g.373394 Transcript_117221/m.373394 type:complete len:359 (+) Transcript_117221:82-1158(+)